MILLNFTKNCMRLRKFWAVGGARTGGAPPKSATEDYTNTQAFGGVYNKSSTKINDTLRGTRGVSFSSGRFIIYPDKFLGISYII